MDPTYEQALSDAKATTACLGLLAIMLADAERLARDGASLVRSNNVPTQESGGRIRDQAADALRLARERMDGLMNDLGEFFNGGDACSASVTDLSEPVYDMLRKRKAGVSLND